MFLFCSLRGFLFRYCPHCLSELRRAITCSIILPPSLVSLLSYFEVFRAFAVGRVLFPYFFVFHYQDLSANQWYIARLALDYFALSSASDAAPSGFVPCFQGSGDSSLFFASFSVHVCSDLLLPDSLCTRLIGLCLES